MKYKRFWLNLLNQIFVFEPKALNEQFQNLINYGYKKKQCVLRSHFTQGSNLLFLSFPKLGFDSYMGNVQNGDAHDGGEMGGRSGSRGRRPRRFNRGGGGGRPRKPEGGNKPAGEKVNNFES